MDWSSDARKGFNHVQPPNLLGVTQTQGDLLIVELKKGKASRDVIAQLLEYAAWASTLTADALAKIAEDYFRSKDSYDQSELADIYKRGFFRSVWNNQRLIGSVTRNSSS